MKAIITPTEYEEIYRMLDEVSPVDFDCGILCGERCCREPEELCEQDRSAQGDEEFAEMGIYLLPGEEAIHDLENEAFIWEIERAEDYEFPLSWEGDVYFGKCPGPDTCERGRRPIQCRTFPLKPKIDEKGSLIMILNDDELPYKCPLIERKICLDQDFITTTYLAWKKLIRDPQIRDLVIAEGG